jgi:hypothetical protein
VRVLRYLNELARDPALYVEMRVGQEGRHWVWDESFGIKKLPPFDHRAFASKELLGEGSLIPWGDNYGYFAPFAPAPELVDRYTTKQGLAFCEKYQRPEWGLKDVLLMAETVPSSSKYLVNLVQLQAITCIEIVTGKKPLDSFDEFVATWHRQGGDVLTREANELYLRKQAIRDNIAKLLPPATP